MSTGMQMDSICRISSSADESLLSKCSIMQMGLSCKRDLARLNLHSGPAGRWHGRFKVGRVESKACGRICRLCRRSARIGGGLNIFARRCSGFFLFLPRDFKGVGTNISIDSNYLTLSGIYLPRLDCQDAVRQFSADMTICVQNYQF